MDEKKGPPSNSKHLHLSLDSQTSSDLTTSPCDSEKATKSGDISQSFLQGLNNLDWSRFYYNEARERIKNFNKSVRRLSDEGISSSIEFVRRYRTSRSSSSGDNEIECPDKNVIARADSVPVQSATTGWETDQTNSIGVGNLSKFSPPPPRPPQPKFTSSHSSTDSSSQQIPLIKVSTQTQTKGSTQTKKNPDGEPCPICYQQLQDFKHKFKHTRSHKEKYEILTSVPTTLVPDDNLTKEFACSDLIAFGAATLRASQGAFSSPPPQFIQHIPQFVKASIANFFKNPENGGEMKGRENCVEISNGVSEKRRIQKRAMFISLSQLYQEYILLFAGSYRSITISRFSYLTPNHIVWSRRFWGNGSDICLLHENLQLLLSACTTYYTDGISQVLASAVCSEKSALCMFGFCENCSVDKCIASIMQDYSYEEVVEFYLWQESDANFSLTSMREAVPQFATRLHSIIKQFLKHKFILSMQKDYLQQANSFLSKDRAFILVKMAFCEPYIVVSKIGPRKASKLFNYDPQRIITVYPFVIKYYDQDKGSLKVQNIVVISNDLRNNPTSAYLFQMEMIKFVKHALPHVKHIIYFVNDNPKHYKNSETILNLLYHEEDHNMKASLEFMVEGHDLTDCGMLATEIKRESRLAALKGKAVIQCAEDLFKFCRKEMTRADLQFCYVDRYISRLQSLEVRLQRRYKLNSGIIPGISHYYSFQPNFIKDFLKEDTIHVKRYSLSLQYNVIKVILSSSSISSIEDIISHSVCSHTHPYDETKLITGNIVTVNLEGKVFTARITDECSVKFGNLGVALIGRVEPKERGKHSHFPLDEDLHVCVSTLDVLLINESGDIAKRKFDNEGMKLKSFDSSKGSGWARGRSLSPSAFLNTIRKKDSK